jgi:transposase
VQQGRPATLEKFFHAPHSVRKETLANRLAAITAAGPLTTDQAVRHSSVLMITALATPMQTTMEALRDFADESEKLGSRPEDSPLFAALPGAGPVDAARLTAALGTDRDRWTTGDALLCFSGVAPVLERRGKSTWMRWRYCCPKFLRQSFHESAGESINHSCWAKAYYRSQRARGKSHQAAVSALAFKWIWIIYRCWQTRTPYSEVRY